MITDVALIVSLTILGGLLVMQILLIAGVPIGHYAWGGKERVMPPRMRVAAVIAIVLYAAFAALLISRAVVLPGGVSLAVIIGTWILFAYSAFSIIANVASRSRQERAVQTPVSVALTLGILVIALSPTT